MICICYSIPLEMFPRLPLQHCKLSPAPPPASESPILKRTKLSWRWCTCSLRSHRYSSRDYKCITIKEVWCASKNLIRNTLARNHRCRSLSRPGSSCQSRKIIPLKWKMQCAFKMRPLPLPFLLLLLLGCTIALAMANNHRLIARTNCSAWHSEL